MKKLKGKMKSKPLKRGMMEIKLRGDKRKLTAEANKKLGNKGKSKYKELHHFEDRRKFLKKDNSMFCNTNQCLF